MADLSGQRLGPFEIRSLIGTGGFATVYRANDPRLQSEVALKILAENHSLDPNIRERFIGEAHALRRVQSQSVINIFDIRETDDGRPYLVLEFADRGDLVRRRQSHAANGWQPASADVLVVVDALADALDAIHAEELVHRDVTPSNVLLRSGRRRSERAGTSIVAADERLLLSDMGLVKDLSAGSGLTVGAGTAGFWAPEQQNHLGRVDHRADIFSATAVVVWLITGTAPLLQPDWPQQVTAAGFGPAMLTALHTGLAPQPDERHQTIHEWHEALRAPLVQSMHAAASVRAAELSVNAPATRIVDPADQSTVNALTRPHRSRRLMAAAGAAAVACIVGVGALVLALGGDLNPGAQDVGDGRVAVVQSQANASLRVIGPERVLVGETALYRFETANVESVTWIDPAGRVWSEPLLEVEASSTGRGTVTAVGVDPAGAAIRAELNFEAATPE